MNNKDLRDPVLIHPRKGKNERSIPPVGILLVNPSEAVEVHDSLRGLGGREQYLFNARLTTDSEQRYFCAGPAIGAPMAALTMEKLIALGAGELILFGWCGAIDECLQVGDVVVPDRAESGEGTSPYYPAARPLQPSRQLQEMVRARLAGHQIKVVSGTVWSTDAVYRESREQLRRLRENRRVVAVDMEFSALCAVAAFRNIRFGAVLVVSDLLYGDHWQPGFKSADFLVSKKACMEILLSYLESRNGKEN